MKRNITADSKVVAANDQVACEVTGEVVILNMKNGSYHGLDPVGSFIWKQLQKPTSVSAVRDALLQRYDVEAERGENDLFEFLEKLADQGLIETTDDASVSQKDLVGITEGRAAGNSSPG
jgi:hypothetical protein